MFVIVAAPSLGIPLAYVSGGGTTHPFPNPPSLITPFATGGPLTTNGNHTLFSGSLPPGNYTVVVACDTTVNGHLDVTFPPLCLEGAFDVLPLTVP